MNSVNECVLCRFQAPLKSHNYDTMCIQVVGRVEQFHVSSFFSTHCSLTRRFFVPMHQKQMQMFAIWLASRIIPYPHNIHQWFSPQLLFTVTSVTFLQHACFTVTRVTEVGVSFSEVRFICSSFPAAFPLPR